MVVFTGMRFAVACHLFCLCDEFLCGQELNVSFSFTFTFATPFNLGFSAINEHCRAGGGLVGCVFHNNTVKPSE